MNSVYHNLLANKQLSPKGKAKRFAYYYARRKGAEKSWSNRHRKLFSLHQSYKKQCDASVELEHQSLWSPFRQKVDMSTLRICRNISGLADARIIPEDIFVSDIEPVLTTDEICHFQSHKSFYNRWFQEGIFPKDYLHRINGQYLDAGLNPLDFEDFKEVAQKLSYPVVMKPNRDSFGGKNVFFVKSSQELLKLSSQSPDFVIQEQIKQHGFFKKFNPVGLNTIRVYVYKSVSDGQLHVINMALRMGKGGSLDNETSGGIHTLIRANGYMNDYAVDKYGERFTNHPDTGYAFNYQIPAYEELKSMAEKVAEQVFFTRIIGLDVCFDESGCWRVIEINTKGHTIRFSQYGGQPFFGKFTEEVIDYCRLNHWTLNSSL